jgi:hypothetical protein
MLPARKFEKPVLYALQTSLTAPVRTSFGVLISQSWSWTLRADGINFAFSRNSFVFC